MTIDGAKRILSSRAAVAALEACLLVIVAALTALIILRILTPVGPIGPISAPTAGQGGGSVSMPSFDMFWPSNRARQSVRVGNWLLHGVTFRAENPTAILSQGKGQPQLVFRKGEALDDGTRLADIGADFVVLERNGAPSTLYLDDAPSENTAPQPPAAGARGISLPGPLDPALLTPYGLRAGDILLAVNGKSVNGPSDLKGFMALQSSGQAVRVTIRRGNETIEKVLR